MTKRSVILSSIVTVIGIILMSVSLVSCGFDFKNLDKKDYETNTYEITESFYNVSIVSNTADITFAPSDSDTARIVCFEHKKTTHSVSVKDGVLTISIDDERKWYDYITPFSFSSPTITVYLPLSEYGALTVSSDTSDVTIPKGFTFESIDISLDTGDFKSSASTQNFVKVDASTGNVQLSDMSAKDLTISLSTGDVTLERCSFENICAKTSTGKHKVSSLTISGDYTLEVSTGDAEINNVNCNSFTSTGNSGEISLKNFTATATLSIERSTGDVELECCTAGCLSVNTSTGDVDFDKSDAGEIYVKTSTGDVEGSLLTSKIFITKTSTGKVKVPASTTGGKCEITTSTGDIEITAP